MSEVWMPDFAKRGGLVPAVVQDARTKEVLMLGWVNAEAWERTLATKKATFWSTSRQELWIKGATSGDELPVVEVRADCDDDTVLYLVEPKGGTCHTKNSRGETRKSCFYRRIESDHTVINLDP